MSIPLRHCFQSCVETGSSLFLIFSKTSYIWTMSKLKTDTRSKIRDKALEMFNERGIEYVGLRELAGILDMRVSNITYYFPTKDDLVYEISMGLNQANSQVMVADDAM